MNRSLRDPRAYRDAPGGTATHDTGRHVRLRALLRTLGVGAIETDADLDSFPAWAEYFLETDPASGADHPLRLYRIGQAANGRLELRFVSGPGSLYRILVSDRLGPEAEWTPCPVATEPGGPWIGSGWLTAWGLETAAYVPWSGSARFFKVEAEP